MFLSFRRSGATSPSEVTDTVPLPVTAGTLEVTASDGTVTDVGYDTGNLSIPVLLRNSSDVEIGTASNPLEVSLRTAMSRLVDSIAVALQTDVLMNGATELTPKFAVIDTGTSGNNTLLAAVTSKKIRVHSVYLVAAAAVTVRFESGADGTALSGQMQLAANGGFVLPFNPLGWFETASGVLLNLELSGTVSVDGGFQYTEV